MNSNLNDTNLSEKQDFQGFGSATENLSKIEERTQKRLEKMKNEENVSFQFAKENTQVQELSLRSNKRDQKLKAKRLQKKIGVGDGLESYRENLTIAKDVFDEYANIQVDKNYLNDYINLFRNSSGLDKYKAILCIRKCLALPDFPPIQPVCEAGMIYDFLQLINDPVCEFQHEALWCLTNITFGDNEYAASIVDKGGLEIIINKLDSNVFEIKELAVWVLGNIIGDNIKYKNKLLDLGGFDRFVKILNTTDKPSLIKQTVWAISNIFKDKLNLNEYTVISAIDPIIRNIYLLENDNEYLVDALWILSYCSENFKKSKKKIIDSEIIPKIITFLDRPVNHIQLPSLRILGNIVSGNANDTQLVVNSGCLPYFKKLLSHEKRNIRKETCWIVSNIAAGTQLQIESLITNDFLPVLENSIKYDEPEIQKEAVWAVANFSSIEKKDLMEYILKCGYLEIITKFLKMKDAKSIAVGLEALTNVLEFGKNYYMKDGKNEVVTKIEQLGAFDLIEDLQSHPVEIIYDKTVKLLETYFDTENVY